MRTGPRILLKVAAVYVVACAPWMVFISTVGPHGPLASVPEAVMYGLRFPWEDIARVIRGSQSDIWLSVVFFWPVFLVGLFCVWWTERSRISTAMKAHETTHDA